MLLGPHDREDVVHCTICKSAFPRKELHVSRKFRIAVCRGCRGKCVLCHEPTKKRRGLTADQLLELVEHRDGAMDGKKPVGFICTSCREIVSKDAEEYDAEDVCPDVSCGCLTSCVTGGTYNFRAFDELLLESGEDFPLPRELSETPYCI